MPRRRAGQQSRVHQRQVRPSGLSATPDLQDSRYLAANRIGDLPYSRPRFHRADLHVRDIHKGQAVDSKTELIRQRMKATARQNLQLVAGPAARSISTRRSGLPPICVSNLVDEALDQCPIRAV